MFVLPPLLLLAAALFGGAACQTSTPATCDRSALHNVTVSGHFERFDRAELFSNINLALMNKFVKLDVRRANVSVLCEGAVHGYPRLRTLSLIDLNISDVERGAFDLPQLHHLSLALNKLRSVKRGQYNNVKSLRTIYLSANEIEYIEEDAFDDMPWLQKVFADRNRLREINGNWFLNSPQVRVVRLSYNRIVYVPASAFRHLLPSHRFPLEYHLDNNGIVDVSDRAVEQTRLPLVLHLERNNISWVSAGVFANLRSVHRLHLEQNRIRCLAEEVLQQMNATSMGLYLDGNPLECACVERFDELVQRNSFTTDFYYNTSLYCPKPQPVFDFSW